jgi:hypothetical protein
MVMLVIREGLDVIFDFFAVIRCKNKTLYTALAMQSLALRSISPLKKRERERIKTVLLLI